MTLDEINHLKATISKGIFNKHDRIWLRAFTEYTYETGNKLGMGCNPCYKKVMEYHLNKKND